MEQPKNDCEALAKIIATSSHRFKFVRRFGDPKDPPNAMRRLDLLEEVEAVDGYIKTLTKTEFFYSEPNESPGHTAPVWVFKKTVSIKQGSTPPVVDILYIKVAFECEDFITVISFHF